MGSRSRLLQFACLLSFFALGALGLRDVPAPRITDTVAAQVEARRHVPPAAQRDTAAGVMLRALARDVAGPQQGSNVWRERRWYTFLLAPLWIGALVLAAGPGPGAGARRRFAGWVLLLVSLGVALFEACYLAAEYAPMLGGAAGRVEGFLVWLTVVGMLAFRRRGDAHAGAVEAHIGSQALLGVAHLLTLPSSHVRVSLAVMPLSDALRALVADYGLAFWGATLLLTLSLVPVYLSARTRRGASSTSPVA